MEKCVPILLISMVLLPSMLNTANAVNCLFALQKIIPCQDYLVHGSTKPSTGCCHGVKGLAEIANKSKSERQSLCQCLKTAAQKLPINEGKAKAMPKLCHVNLNITITPHIDCTKV